MRLPPNVSIIKLIDDWKLLTRNSSTFRTLGFKKRWEARATFFVNNLLFSNRKTLVIVIIGCENSERKKTIDALWSRKKFSVALAQMIYFIFLMPPNFFCFVFHQERKAGFLRKNVRIAILLTSIAIRIFRNISYHYLTWS